MKEVIIKIVYAFSIGGMGGNPAGVVLDADNLTDEEKQLVASKVGISEISFVSKSETADFKLDFFTPNKQIAHCGHATVATFSYLNQLKLVSGERSSKQTIDGNRDIFFKNELTYMEQAAPEYTDVDHEMEDIFSSLGLSKDELLEGYQPAIVNTGNSFLIVPVANRNILERIQPDLDKIASYSDKHDLIGYYVYTPEIGEEVTATTRMFAPRYGIAEESATGMAAGPLACYLYDHKFTSDSEILFKQGEFMDTPSPSLLMVDLILSNGKIEKLFAGGNAYVAEERVVKL